MDAHQAKLVIKELILNGNFSLAASAYSEQDILRALFLAENNLGTAGDLGSDGNNQSWDEYSTFAENEQNFHTNTNPKYSPIEQEDNEDTFSIESVFGEEYSFAQDESTLDILNEIYNDADSYASSSEDGWFYDD